MGDMQEREACGREACGRGDMQGDMQEAEESGVAEACGRAEGMQDRGMPVCGCDVQVFLSKQTQPPHLMLRSHYVPTKKHDWPKTLAKGCHLTRQSSADAGVLSHIS